MSGVTMTGAEMIFLTVVSHSPTQCFSWVVADILLRSAMLRTSMKQQEAIMATQMMMTEALLFQVKGQRETGGDELSEEEGECRLSGRAVGRCSLSVVV